MDTGPELHAPTLLERAKAILLKPVAEWPTIAKEATPTRDIFIGYVLPMAAIAPIAGFIGGQLFGYGAFGFSFKPGLMSGLVMAVVSFVLGVINVLVMTLIADFLSPKFGGEMSNMKAFKLVVYSATAVWVAGILGLLPSLGLLAIVAAIYSFYVFYLGTGPMLGIPDEKRATFTVAVVVCALILNFVVGGLVQANMRFLSGMGLIGSTSDVSGTVTVPGMGKIDTDELDKLSQRMEDAAAGKIPPVDTAKLQALLPESSGAYARTSIESTTMGQMGSTVEARYESGDKGFTLTVTDMSAMGAVASLGGAFGVQQSREDADGYERTESVDGQMRTEAWNKTAGSGKYGVVVAKRFMVEAEGQAGSIDDLKAAVSAIDQDALEDLAE